jgi:integrase
MSHGKPFSLLKRNSVYYVRFRLPDGTRSTPRSTGQTARGRAEQWAIECLKENRVFSSKDRITFSEYSKDFFNETGTYAMNKRNSGKRLGLHHLRERRDILEHHINPFLGNYALHDIKYRDLETFRNSMFSKGYAGQTISKCLQTINAILREACKDELINALPLIPDCSTAVKKQRGCLSVEEMRVLLQRNRWKDIRVYAACMLSASTGLRIGEIQGLVMSDLHFSEGFLVCRRSYDYRFRVLNPTTKNGRARNIVLSSKVIEILQKMIASSPHSNLTEESPVFWADTISANPIERNTIIKGYNRALASMDISKEIRSQRGLCFHSFRHFCNSFYVNSKLPLQQIQNQLGHLSPEMTERYYHVTMSEMNEVRQAQNSMLNGSHIIQ